MVVWHMQKIMPISPGTFSMSATVGRGPRHIMIPPILLATFNFFYDPSGPTTITGLGGGHR